MEPLSLNKEDETHILSSDESDFEQAHSVTSIKKQSSRASPPTRNHRYKTAPPVSGPYQIGSFIKITNRYKGAQGTVGKVISSQKIYTTIEDIFGNTHKREYQNFAITLDKRDQKIVTEYIRSTTK